MYNHECRIWADGGTGYTTISINCTGNMANKVQRHYARTLLVSVARLEGPAAHYLSVFCSVFCPIQTEVLEARKAKSKMKTQRIVCDFCFPRILV